jgi:hypothetical protein
MTVSHDRDWGELAARHTQNNGERDYLAAVAALSISETNDQPPNSLSEIAVVAIDRFDGQLAGHSPFLCLCFFLPKSSQGSDSNTQTRLKID